MSKLYVDVTDLLNFLGDIGHVTGIQRVQVSLLKRAFATATASLLLPTGSELVPVAFYGEWGFGLRALPGAAIEELLRMLDADAVSSKSVADAVTYIMAEESEVEPHAGDTLLISGAFWNNPSYIPLVQDIAATGVLVSAIIYDIIPIDAPEYCVEQLSVQFGSTLDGLVDHVSVYLCISDYTASRLRAYLAERGLQDSTVAVFKLAHRLDSSAAAHIEPTARVRALVKAMGKNGYAIHVGTLEVRKNLRYLSDVWHELRIRFPATTPALLLVGRPGWGMSDTLDLIAMRNRAGKYVHIEHGFSDNEVAYLYEKSLFAVFPSFLEGWGLPVGEALAHGKVVFASNTSSIPEVGGSFANYIDPLSVRDGVEKIAQYLEQPDLLQEREQEIAEGFNVRTWDDVYGSFAEAFRPIVADPGGAIRSSNPAARAAVLPVGRIYSPGVPSHRAIAPSRRVLTKGWNAPEEWGAWSSASSAEILFKIDDPDVTEIDLDLEVRLAPWLAESVLEVSAGMASPRVLNHVRVTGLPRWYRLRVPVETGIVLVRMVLPMSLEPGPDGDTRTLGFGLSNLMWFYPTDYDRKLRALEIRLLGPQFYPPEDLD
jgi:glycosyltransferase involved in cell wall biosynthesis